MKVNGMSKESRQSDRTRWIKRMFGVGTMVLLTACTDSSLPDPELVRTYADVVLARQTIADSAKLKQTLDSIMTAHGMDSTQFAEKLREMSRTPELFKGFYDSVTVKLSSP
jgi:hypothetical protein